jgi:hypothetical protein
MRCPSCNKFAAYDEPEVEVIDSDVDGNTVRGNVRIVLKCAEDGEELKDAELEFEAQIEHECDNSEKEKKLDEAIAAHKCPKCNADLKDVGNDKWTCPGGCFTDVELDEIEAELHDEFNEEPEFEIEDDFDASSTDRFEDKDRHGKPIKSMRYQRHYYGAEITGSVKCSKCGEVIQIDTSVEEAASGFNELV